MNINNVWNSIKNSMYKQYGQNSGKMIIHAGAAAWFLSSLAQITAVVFNDKIPSEQKKFLIPQEIADAAVNVVSFYLITSAIKNLGSKLVKTGKWSNKGIRDFVGQKVKMGDMKTDLSEKFKGNEEFYKVYSPFNNGIDMITTTIGSVISCNIITPYARNYFGARQQKLSIAQDKMKNNNTSAMIPTSPILPAQNRFGIDDYRAKVMSASTGLIKV